MVALTENCKQGLEAVAGGAERDTSWPELTRKESGSGEPWADAVFMTFLQVVLLSVLRFCSSPIQLRICFPLLMMLYVIYLFIPL